MRKGDPKKLMVPFDEDRRGCGYDSDLKDYKYLYFYQLGKNSTEWQVIISSPNYNRSSILTAAFCANQCPPSSYVDSSKTLAGLGIKCATEDSQGKTAEGLMCDTYKGYNSTTWLAGFCIPVFDSLDQSTKEYSTTILTLLEDSTSPQKWAKDIMISRWLLFISIIITIVVSTLYICLFGCSPRAFMTGTIILLVIMFIIGGFLFSNLEKSWKNKIDMTTGSGIFIINNRIQYSGGVKEVYSFP